MENQKVVSTLNDLIETSKDGEEGFNSCTEHIREPELKTFFAHRAQACAKAVADLQELVIAYGGSPGSGSSIRGTLHRRWIDIKSLVTGRDDEAILNECERGEDVAVNSYRTALEQDLPPEVRTVVERQYQGVLQNHAEVKRLREQARGHRS